MYVAVSLEPLIMDCDRDAFNIKVPPVAEFKAPICLIEPPPAGFPEPCTTDQVYLGMAMTVQAWTLDPTSVEIVVSPDATGPESSPCPMKSAPDCPAPVFPRKDRTADNPLFTTRLSK